MAKILFAWELGGSLGHLTRIYPILLALEQRGHQVSAAVRDQKHITAVWPNLKATVLPAPYKAHPTADEIHPVKYYVDILNNIGWGNAQDLRMLLQDWETVYRNVRPDFVIHDHSPTALLISQSLQVRHALLGTGFCSPLDESLSRLLRTWVTPDLALEQQISARIVNNLNQILLPGTQQISRPTQIYSRVDENFLTTFPELDHFGARPNATYWGIPNATQGIRPAWPEVGGPKLFAYLHADARLQQTLHVLEKIGKPTLVYISGKWDHSAAAGSATLKIVNQPVDLEWVGRECAVGILNGSHGATAAFLMAGKPILQLPIQLEQYLCAKRSVELEAALIVDRYQPEMIVPALRQLLYESHFTMKANQFRERYRNWTPASRVSRIVGRIEELLRR